MSITARRLTRALSAEYTPPGGGAVPGDYTNLLLWLKADAITGVADGAAVASWPDLSGHNYHATNSTAIERPTFIVNGTNSLPVVRFNGSQTLGANAPTSGGEQTVIAVIKPSSLSGVKTIRGGAVQFRLEDDSIQVVHEGVGLIAKAFLPAASTEFQVLTMTLSTSSGTVGMWLGNVCGWYGAQSAGPFSADTTGIGVSTIWGEVFTGDIAEIACYDRVLDDTERTTLVTSLRQKWNAVYPADLPAPPNGVFTGQKVAIIGDSLTNQSGAGSVNVPASLVNAGWPSGGVWFYGVDGKTINTPDAGGYTTVQNIQQCLTNFGTPDVWIFTLGGNSVGAPDRADQIQAVLDAVGSEAKVLWTTMGTANAANDSSILSLNTLIKQICGDRPHTYVGDWFAYCFTHVQDNWWSDGVHMTTGGYAVRNAFVAQQSIYASLVE